MSSTVLKIIPTIPNYVPSDAQQERAKEFLSEFFDPDHTEVLVTDEIEFIDQGANFENVYCNVCGAVILTEEWQDQMNEAYETQFQNLNFETSCQHRTSLNELTYNWPAGFAKFVIRISDPGIELTESNFERLNEILGMKMRAIWAHY